MSINKNWNRWIFASLGAYYKSVMPDAQKLAVEGQLESDVGDYIELRMSGPDWYECTKGRWHGELVANFLVKVVKDENDAHKIYRITGLMESLIANCIPIMQQGDTAGDDPTVKIGELALYWKDGRDIRTQHFGQLENTVPSIQSTIEVYYRTDLDEP